MSREIEEGTPLKLDFTKIGKVAESVPGVIPAVAQDIETGLVLMVGYVNEQALRTALEKKVAVFWSTSRDELWIKGATSGDTLELIEARVNCEQNSILYLVRPKGEGACHTQSPDGISRISCYYRVIDEGELRHAPYQPIWQGHDSTQG
ncbi:phosphoribosyl-AMP cyclohydrolase [Puniceicoccales bacterium CK1056]|uniref:phosphoribosyl-AMP cyclohydrolase n=1 Tax=Oceanipulchritudo coccoides TaxID=2706888 RepID=A0A6B2LX87_9BACT|nr:phosphoribosyl-AMP cyclohydrolase [Oceanipulchritudo coccoides]NDV61198.1 phosphoribosyl-AMP cyclohydrolase [Oceanipulchritudo coccoides]